MKILLDTHAWLWHLAGSKFLPKRIRHLIDDPENEVWISAISVWETLILGEKGKLVLSPDPTTWIHKALTLAPFKQAPVNHEIAIKSRELLLATEDPADRFIVATAVIFKLHLITKDKHILSCKEVPTISI